MDREKLPASSADLVKEVLIGGAFFLFVTASCLTWLYERSREELLHTVSHEIASLTHLAAHHVGGHGEEPPLLDEDSIDHLVDQLQSSSGASLQRVVVVQVDPDGNSEILFERVTGVHQPDLPFVLEGEGARMAYRAAYERTEEVSLAAAEEDRGGAFYGFAPILLDEAASSAVSGQPLLVLEFSPDYFRERARGLLESTLLVALTLLMLGALLLAGLIHMRLKARRAEERSHKSEVALRLSEERFRRMFIHSPVGLALCEMDGTLIEVNQAYLDIIGYSADEYRDLGYWQLTPPEYFEKEREQLERLRQEGRFGPYEKEYVHKGGHRVPVLLNGVVVSDRDNTSRIWTVVQDITERKKAEQDLRESEHRFRDVAEAAGEYIFEIDTETRFTFATEALGRVLQRPMEEILGKRALDFMPEEDAREVGEWLSCRVREKQKFNGLEHRWLTPGGAVIWQSVSGLPVLGPDGLVIGFRGAGMDVTERKRAERALFESEERFELCVRGSSVGLWDWNLRTGQFYWSPRLRDILLISEGGDTTTMEEFEKLVHKEDLERKIEAVRKHLREGEPYDIEYRLRRSDGEYVWMHARGQCITGEDGEPTRMAGSISDISDRKRMEQKLIKAARRASTANRAKSDFLANMSHEIRTPMNAIMGMTTVLEDTPLDNAQRDFVATIRNSSESLLGIINDILDFSKIEAGQLEIEKIPFEPVACYENILDLFSQKAAAKGLDLNLEVVEPVPTRIMGDPTRLRQILVNLVGNAVKFTEKGEILIVLKVRRASTGQVSLLTEVRDTGIGIAPEHQKSLFRPFSQADSSTTRRFGGTGLGLVISQRLARAMGGELDLESAVGQGTTFRFEVVCESLGQGEDAGAAPQVASGKRLLALCASPTRSRILAGMAEVTGAQMAVEGTPEAVQKALEARPCDTLLVETSALEGLDPAGWIRDLRAGCGQTELPVILLVPHGRHFYRKSFAGLERVCVVFLPLKRTTLEGSLRASLSATKGSATELEQEERRRQAPIRPLDGAGSSRLLLVEDDRVNQMVAKQFLKRLGFEADVAGNGQEALEAMGRHPYDILLMDKHMPVMDGVEATKRIRAEYGERPYIIAMTAAATVEDRATCLHAGMNHFVTKPVKLDELSAALQGACSSRRHAAEAEEAFAEEQEAAEQEEAPFGQEG